MPTPTLPAGASLGSAAPDGPPKAAEDETNPAVAVCATGADPSGATDSSPSPTGPPCCRILPRVFSICGIPPLSVSTTIGWLIEERLKAQPMMKNTAPVPIARSETPKETTEVKSEERRNAAFITVARRGSSCESSEYVLPPDASRACVLMASAWENAAIGLFTNWLARNGASCET